MQRVSQLLVSQDAKKALKLKYLVQQMLLQRSRVLTVAYVAMTVQTLVFG